MKLIAIFVILIPCILSANDAYMLYDDSEVAIIEISVAPEDLVWIYENVNSDSLHEATVHFTNALIDETIEQVGFRLRGNTSRDAQKKSFKLSFNSFVPGRQFYDVEKLNLNGEHNDPSIIRSKLCWDHYQKTSMVATQAAHCAVFINDEYFGLYISVEHIDEEFLENHYDDDSGNLWKCLWPADLTYQGPDPEDYHPYVGDARPYELKTNIDEYDYAKLAKLIDIINNTLAVDFPDSLERVLVVPEVLQYAAMNVLTGNWDDYWFLMNNFYLYHEPAIDRIHWIPFDNDNSFGIDWFSTDWTQVDPYSYANIEETQGNDPGPRPLMENIMDNAQYRNLYTHFIQFFQDNFYALDLWESRLDSLKDMITPWAEADTYRQLDYGFTIPDFHQSYSPNPWSQQHVKNGLKEFIILRNTSLLNQLVWEDVPPIIYDIEYSPRFPGPSDSIYITAAAFSHAGLAELTIAFHPGDLAVVESYPMTFEPLESSTIVEEADRWVGVIPPMGDFGYGRFQIGAEDLNGQSMIFPRSDFVYLEVPASAESPLVINEFLTQNDNVNTDENGEYDDWVEIFNPDEEDINLSGLYLTDDPSNLTKWQFPFAGVMLAAGEYLLVWCDEDQEQPGLHANFKLSASGEYIALVASDGMSIIDGMYFGEQQPDVSYGRFPNGSDSWSFFAEPTPGAANTTSGIEPTPVAPETFKLHNFPNPFNAETTIRFNLPWNGTVSVSVFDLSGRLVSELFHGMSQKGEYEIAWNARDSSGQPVSTGIYLYQIQIKGYRKTQKMLLLK
ncbi:CotH kinase family protein [bacterium]|nr:CotH kinase family protein [bacterium]